jgi:hypothetical protein
MRTCVSSTAQGLEQGEGGAVSLRVGWVERRLEAAMESCEPSLADNEAVGEDGTPGFVAGLEVEATADPFASLRDDNKEGGDSEEGAAAASAASASRMDCFDDLPAAFERVYDDGPNEQENVFGRGVGSADHGALEGPREPHRGRGSDVTLRNAR